jgi:hypothetical protein
MRKALLIGILFLSAAGLTAQWQDTVWVIGGDRVLGDGFKKWRVELAFDARSTFVDGQTSRLGGLRVGMEYKRVHRFGIGIYGLNNQLGAESLSQIDENVDSALFSFSYLSLYYERVFYFHPKWELSSTFHLGSGDLRVSYSLEDEDQFTELEPIRVKPMEISTSAYYNVWWWLSAGGGIGYRYMRKAPTEVRDIYNSPIYLIKLKIRFGRIVKSFFNEDVKNEY